MNIFKLFKSKFSKDSIKMTGRVELVCRDKDGNIKWAEKKNNTVMYVGKAQMALLVAATGSLFTFLALGSSSTAPDPTQTALLSEFTTGGLSRVAATVSRITTAQSNDTTQWVATYNASTSNTIAEIGIFNASSAGTMLARATPTSRSTVSGDVVTATYTMQFS